MTGARVAVLLLLAAACSSPTSPIRIGLAGPLSDPVGSPMRRAAEMAVAEINGAGGVDGRMIELVARDDRGSPDTAVRVAGELAADQVVAVIGHVYSGTTIAAAPVYGAGPDPVPVLTPSSSAPEVTGSGGHIFRLCPTDLEHGAALANWIRHGLGLSRGAVLYLDNPYGRGIRQAFALRFRALGGTLLSVDPYLGDRPDVSAYLDRLERLGGLEFLVVAGNREDAEAIVLAVRTRGLTVPILGGDGLEGIETSPAGEGVYLTAAYLPALDTPANRRFVQAYQARFPGTGLPNQPAAATYDALYLLRDVLRSGATTRRAIEAALASLGDDLPPHQGATGVLGHDGLGDLARMPVLIGRAGGGTVQLVERR